MRANPDVTELRDFYRTPLGGLVRRLLSKQIQDWWPDVGGKTVYGLGFTVPFFDCFANQNSHLAALMPARQGVLVWPPGGKYRSVLVDDCQLPLLDASVDRLLMVHALEMSEAAHTLLREIWRVLSPEGKLLVIVPNRRGIWSRFDTTPFGHGRPYSRGQLRRLLTGARFAPQRFDHALFMPPANERLFLRSAPAWERVGKSLWPAFSGLLVAEAAKQIYAPIGGKKEVISSNLAIPVPAVPFESLDCPPEPSRRTKHAGQTAKIGQAS